MTLTRTKSGLQNLHILKHVDLVVYTEGGEHKTLSREEVFAGKGHEISSDIRFWKKLFSLFLPDKKVKILSVGSCNTLNQIALDIAMGDLRNICVAMDRDYSTFWRKYASHPQIIRTRTYSWENEIFQTDVILRAFEKVAIESLDEAETRRIIDGARSTLLCQLKHLLRADLILVAATKSLFNRKKPASCFKHVGGATGLPEIDRQRMKERLRSERAEIGSFRLVIRPSAASVDTARDIFGKPLFIAACRILQHLISTANQKSIPNEYLEKFLIDAFFDWIADNRGAGIAAHYEEKLSNIPYAA